ncbi:hypothetical protein MKW94_011037 [Papaver nudicaule]|uniref:non-specific serine/threonine protein kinase n=1 Tax=Papaver nudicaule TaxID=74823 RepID=A0AA41VZJ4_PAPNU|nr:hypothetical protein [Papaver nudicaule]
MKLLRMRSLRNVFSFSKHVVEDNNSTISSCDHSFHENEMKNETKSVMPSTEEQSQKPTWKCFSFDEIFDATNGFSKENLVGRGGYAEVYRGVMKNGEVIAVKRLTKASTDERKEKEFLQEIGTIGHVHHPNVSSLMGCCLDNGLYLIFAFSLHGSVASVLHDENSPLMSWKTRYKIAVGTARGLHYLHKGCQRRIIHRDIKSSNVLLTADYEPQISDFGLAKWLPSQWTHHSVVPIEGTFGCLAPEYFMHGIVDEKTDNSDRSLSLLCTTCLVLIEVFLYKLCVLEVIMVDGEMTKENWKMPDEVEEEEFWGFEDLECEFDSPDSTSPLNSISSRSS